MNIARFRWPVLVMAAITARKPLNAILPGSRTTHRKPDPIEIAGIRDYSNNIGCALDVHRSGGIQGTGGNTATAEMAVWNAQRIINSWGAVR